jgi:hypothetical protein
MAQTLGEEVGETVGYRVRMDSRIGPRTRIEVITDGVFTRMIQDSPDLDGVGAVLFDEFHERSLDGDLGLALCLEAQDALRPDLRLMPMSATLDGASVSTFLGDCPVIESCLIELIDMRCCDLIRQHALVTPAFMQQQPEFADRRGFLRQNRQSLINHLPHHGQWCRVVHQSAGASYQAYHESSG